MKKLGLFVLCWEIILALIIGSTFLSSIYSWYLTEGLVAVKYQLQGIWEITTIYLLLPLYSYFSYKENRIGRKTILSLMLLTAGIHWTNTAYFRYTVLKEHGDSYGVGGQKSAFIENAQIAGAFIISSLLPWIPKIGNSLESTFRLVLITVAPILLTLFLVYSLYLAN